jgi:hypothetical protein
MIGPTSSPHAIACALHQEVIRCDKHSPNIKGYRGTFKRLATKWLSDSSISDTDFRTIIGYVNAPSFAIWRPYVYIIPREPIERAGRLKVVNAKSRAGVGPEYQIQDLDTSEFDIIEWDL